jgi:hypothetical protein
VAKDFRICAFGLWPSHTAIHPRDIPPNALQVETARAWLRLFGTKTKSMNRRRTSYGMKHTAEHWAGRYVSNGALLRAAESEGYRIERTRPGSPNGHLNIYVRKTPRYV